tara:strand:- start:108 stop:314 length:207 start_codon:yes stop_codon:yes gene_type:complete
MTPKQFEDLYKMISTNVNNTNLLGQDLEKQYDKNLNVEKNISLFMQNQTLLFKELQEVKRLLLGKSQK